MPYKIVAYIPVEVDEPEIFKTYKEAKEEKEHLQFMQPENIYRIKRVEAKRRKSCIKRLSKEPY